MMHAAYTYDGDSSADAKDPKPGIKLTASEPLSPNAFVQIPADAPASVETEVHTPASRQKKMRIPHGGSVERPVQRTSRKPTPSAKANPEPTAPSPSLHIVLETDPDEEPTRHEEEPESLAQFVANFPKIPDGLIYDDDEPEEDESLEGSEDEDDLRAPQGPYGSSAFRGPGRRGTGGDERMMPVNPRFEKMIRDATNPRAPYGVSGDLPPRGTQRPLRSPMAAGGVLGRSSGPSFQRSPLYPTGSGPLNAGRSGRNSANLPPAGVRGVPPAGVRAVPGRARGARYALNTSSPGITRPLKTSLPSPMGQLRPSEKAPSVLGKPLVDANALEESTIFDEPPIPIAEGMKDADKNHSKGRKFVFIGLALLVVAAVGAYVVLGNQGSVPIPQFVITTTDAGSSGSDGSGSGGGSNTGGDIAGVSSSSQDFSGGSAADATGAGSVTYKYTARTPSGIEYTVEESTTFDESGNCTFTTMRMQFPSETAAKDYTDSLARDLGSKYTLDSLNGANATVTVDNSALGLNREDYENALRYSVDDLVILKK